MPVDCNNTKNDPERQLCSCQKATDAMVKALQDYENKYTQYTSDMASYNRWLQKYNDWQNKRGDYSKWNDIISSKDTTFNMDLGWYNDCHGRSNQDDTNWQCGNKASNDHKYDGWGFYAYDEYMTGGIGPCHWFGVRCGRKQDSKNKIDNDYNADKPTKDPQDSSKSWLGINQPTQPSAPQGNTIQCCSQIFSDLNAGGNVSLSNISQNCSQRINAEINKPAPTPSSSPAPVPVPPGSTPTPDIKQRIQTALSQPDAKFWIVIIILVCIMSVSNLSTILVIS
jgi:hypothetical protein